jgi:hypothetical protein
VICTATVAIDRDRMRSSGGNLNRIGTEKTAGGARKLSRDLRK